MSRDCCQGEPRVRTRCYLSGGNTLVEANSRATGGFPDTMVRCGSREQSLVGRGTGAGRHSRTNRGRRGRSGAGSACARRARHRRPSFALPAPDRSRLQPPVACSALRAAHRSIVIAIGGEVASSTPGRRRTFAAELDLLRDEARCGLGGLGSVVIEVPSSVVTGWAAAPLGSHGHVGRTARPRRTLGHGPGLYRGSGIGC